MRPPLQVWRRRYLPRHDYPCSGGRTPPRPSIVLVLVLVLPQPRMSLSRPPSHDDHVHIIWSKLELFNAAESKSPINADQTSVCLAAYPAIASHPSALRGLAGT